MTTGRQGQEGAAVPNFDPANSNYAKALEKLIYSMPIAQFSRSKCLLLPVLCATGLVTMRNFPLGLEVTQMNERIKYQGSCHCKRVRFELEATLDYLVECNCQLTDVRRR